MIEQSSGLECAWLEARLRGFEQECILRIRRGAHWCEASNRDAPEQLPSEPRSRAFRTASVTKTFTATLILLLCEQGRLALDDRLEQYIAADLCDALHCLDGLHAGRSITLLQLLNHRSGLHDYATDADFIAAVNACPERRWSARDLLDAAMRRAPDFAPGAGLAYNDTGYVLLGLIIEAVTGMPLAGAYRALLLDPLGLRHTYLEGKEKASGPALSRAFADKQDSSGFDPSFDAFGGGGLVSTAGDLDRFISALLQGKIFSNPATLASMLTGTAAAAGSGTRKTLTACGISEFSVAGQRLWGHLGHWNSFMLYAPEADLALCGSFNQSRSEPAQIAMLETAVRAALAWPD